VQVGRVTNRSDLTAAEEAPEGKVSKVFNELATVVAGMAKKPASAARAGKQQCAGNINRGVLPAVALQHVVEILPGRVGIA